MVPVKGKNMFVKVCGLVDPIQIDKAIEYGYNAIGVVAYHKSIRYCSPEKAIKLAEYARGKIDSFVVGIHYSDVEAAADAFDYVQIYERRQLANLVFASHEKPPKDLNCSYFMYDTSVGSGEFKTFPKWLKDVAGRLIVAGGLDKDNVCNVIRKIKPFGVDVSSGVEKDGVKNFELMQDFIGAVRNCI
jgi:phosphoribosylanthranilate isomerase